MRRETFPAQPERRLPVQENHREFSEYFFGKDEPAMKNRGWKKAVLLTLLGCLLAGLLPAPARAEDFFTLNVDTLDMDSLNQNDYVAANLSAACQGIRVKKTISASSELAEPVRLSLTRMDTQTLLFDKDYGYQSRNFDSDVIYLPYGGGSTVPYLVTLYVGDTVYAMPFMQLQPRLQFNSACTYGVRLRDLGLSGDWLMGTMLNLTELRNVGMKEIPLCASNAFYIGSATVMMQGDYLSVQLSFYPEANVEVHGASVYVITNGASLTGDPAYSGMAALSVGDWADVTGASTALLYLPMQVSYDPSGLPSLDYDEGSASTQEQLRLWQQNLSGDVQPVDTFVPDTDWQIIETPEPYWQDGVPAYDGEGDSQWTEQPDSSGESSIERGW